METIEEPARYGLKSTTEENGNPQFTLVEIASLFRRNGDKPCRPHIHDFYQIIWFRRGGGVHHVDFNTYPIEAETLFFLSPGQIHSFDADASDDGIVIHFNESFLSDEGSSENVFLKYDIFNAFDTAPYFKVPAVDVPRLEYIVKEMTDEMPKTGQFAHADCLKYLLKFFLVTIQRTGVRGVGSSLSYNGPQKLDTELRQNKTLDFVVRYGKGNTKKVHA